MTLPKDKIVSDVGLIMGLLCFVIILALVGLVTVVAWAIRDMTRLLRGSVETAIHIWTHRAEMRRTAGSIQKKCSTTVR